MRALRTRPAYAATDTIIKKYIIPSNPMFRSKERTGLYAMAAEITATYGGFYQPLRDWSEVYREYVKRDLIERDLATRYMQDVANLRIQPMASDIELIAWTRSDYNVDIVVGSTNRNFYLLHNVQAFTYEGTLRVVGITGQKFQSCYMQVRGKHDTLDFHGRTAEAGQAIDNSRDSTKKKLRTLACSEEADHDDQAETRSSLIICPTFLTKHLLTNTVSGNGFTPSTLTWAVRQAAKDHFPQVFSGTVVTPQNIDDVQACQHFLGGYEIFLQTAAENPNMIFARTVVPVTSPLNRKLRNVIFRPLKLIESRFWQPSELGQYERITAPMAYRNVVWGPTRSQDEIDRQAIEIEAEQR